MAKKKFVENEDGSTEAVDVVITDKKEKKEYRLKTKGQNIKAEKKKNHKDMFFMNYKDGMKLIKKMKKAGKSGQVVHRKMLRHVSLPYHMSGKAAMDEATNWIAQNTVGKYRKEFKGIVVAVGDVETASEPRVIADQLTFHTDVLINQVVFIPKLGDQYEAKVKYVQEGLMVGVVMDMITIHVKQNEKMSEDSVAINDVILVKYTGIRIKSSLCHLKGEYAGMVEKAPIEEEEAEIKAEEEEEEVKEEVEEMDEE
uniref:DNA-directed RNA polymerase I subunit RPA43 n=1 Tax=Caenorhabditis japonica TaxID=281687 RepID=A0A8R1IB10_CAEJA